MALPKSGSSDSNVLKLEDVRNKHKKSTRTPKKRTRTRIVDDPHISNADFENNVHPEEEGTSAIVCSITDSLEQNTDVESDVISTPAKRSLVSNRRFDKVKVERIKAELANGSYQIDYLRVADKFIEHERFG